MYEATKLASGRSKRLAAFYEQRGLTKHGGVVMTTAEANAAGSTTAKPTPKPAARTISSYDLQRAADNARAAERQRWEAVMLSKAAEGREKLAAILLCTENSNADAIRAKLAGMPTDAERARRDAAVRQAKATATWDRAIAEVFGTDDPPENPNANHGWAGIHEEIRNRRV